MTPLGLLRPAKSPSGYRVKRLAFYPNNYVYYEEAPCCYLQSNIQDLLKKIKISISFFFLYYQMLVEKYGLIAVIYVIIFFQKTFFLCHRYEIPVLLNLFEFHGSEDLKIFILLYIHVLSIFFPRFKNALTAKQKDEKKFFDIFIRIPSMIYHLFAQ